MAPQEEGEEKDTKEEESRIRPLCLSVCLPVCLSVWGR